MFGTLCTSEEWVGNCTIHRGSDMKWMQTPLLLHKTGVIYESSLGLTTPWLDVIQDAFDHRIPRENISFTS